MKKMFKFNVIATALLFAAIVAANAQGRGRMSDPGQYCSNIPGLTEKQKSELVALAEKHRTEMEALRAERQGAQSRDEWFNTGQKMKEVSDKHRFDVLNTLTPEQRASYTPRNGNTYGPSNRPNGRGMGNAPGFASGRGACKGMRSPGMTGGGRGWRR